MQLCIGLKCPTASYAVHQEIPTIIAVAHSIETQAGYLLQNSSCLTHKSSIFAAAENSLGQEDYRSQSIRITMRVFRLTLEGRIISQPQHSFLDQELSGLASNCLDSTESIMALKALVLLSSKTRVYRSWILSCCLLVQCLTPLSESSEIWMLRCQNLAMRKNMTSVIGSISQNKLIQDSFSKARNNRGVQDWRFRGHIIDGRSR